MCLNPRRGPEAPAGILAGLVPVTAPERAGDGSMRFRIMTKSRKRKNRHGIGQADEQALVGKRTCLLPNSLLTGKLTGNFEKIGGF